MMEQVLVVNRRSSVKEPHLQEPCRHDSRESVYVRGCVGLTGEPNEEGHAIDSIGRSQMLTLMIETIRSSTFTKGKPSTFWGIVRG